jgi:rod shape-determining protein MreD
MSSGEPRFRMLFTVLVGLVLTILPLPFYGDIVRPPFLVLTVLYWSMAAPRAGGIGLGWFSGLLLDVFQGPVLGEHALALAAVTYIFVREHQKIRSKPGFQQGLIAMAALATYEVLLFLIDEYTGHPITSPLRWVHILTGAIVWPAAAAIIGYRERRA